MRNSLTTTTLALVGAAITGVALGFVIQILQGLLGGSTAVLANSGAIWAFVAFSLGLVMPTARTAAVGGAICLVVASISYYVAVDWFEGITSSPRGAVIWSIAGVLAGAAFGSAGFVARHNRRHRRLAWALVAGVLIGEGVHLTWYVGNEKLRPAGIAELAVAAIIAIVILRRARSATFVATITAAAALSTLLASSLIDAAFATL
jgi:uncharacterized protein DUF6518